MRQVYQVSVSFISSFGCIDFGAEYVLSKECEFYMLLYLLVVVI